MKTEHSCAEFYTIRLYFINHDFHEIKALNFNFFLCNCQLGIIPRQCTDLCLYRPIIQTTPMMKIYMTPQGKMGKYHFPFQNAH
jgi:hypothetical protein